MENKSPDEREIGLIITSFLIGLIFSIITDSTKYVIAVSGFWIAIELFDIRRQLTRRTK